MGTAFGGVKGRSQLPGMVEQTMKGEIELAPFVTPPTRWTGSTKRLI